MKTLTVHTSTPYSIVIERGILKRCGKEARLVSTAQRAAVVTDSNVAPLYAQTVLKSLEESGFAASLHVFPAGEAQKRLSSIEKMYEHFLTHSLTRTDLIVALGGGVTGDMAGFAAATYLRGVDFIQIPTTLLSQIDSSVGGKTGVDLPFGKNLVGAFWQPTRVLIDPDVLKSLPARYFSDGMAEAIKYGCIKSRPLFERIQHEEAANFLEDLIFECVDIKRRIVEEDEHDKGERMLLNFGHTLGHAIEKAHGYTTPSHGEAVGIGMYALTKAAEAHGLTAPGCAEQILKALTKYHLPYEDSTPLADLAAFCAADKKSAGSDIRLVLLRDIGESFSYKISHKNLLAFLEKGGKR